MNGYKNVNYADTAHDSRYKPADIVAFLAEKLLYSSVNCHGNKKQKEPQMILAFCENRKKYTCKISYQYSRTSGAERKLPAFYKKRTVGSLVAAESYAQKFADIHLLHTYSFAKFGEQTNKTDRIEYRYFSLAKYPNPYFHYGYLFCQQEKCHAEKMTKTSV